MIAEPMPSLVEMRDALVRVAEQATFTIIYDSNAQPNWPTEGLVARIQIHNPYVGQLLLVAPHDWSRSIAASFEWRDKPDDQSNQQKADALGEMLNMVCGILVGDGGSKTAQPDFGSPHVDVIQRPTLDKILDMASRRVVLETESGDPIGLLFVQDHGSAS